MEVIDRDMVKTRTGLIIRSVGWAGIQSPYVEGYINYYPSVSGDRGTEGYRYARSNGSEDIKIDGHPCAVSYSPSLGAPVTRIPKKDIIDHYASKDRLPKALSEIGRKSKLTRPDTVLVDIVSKITAHTSIAISDMGITGSYLPKLENENSDVDLILYDLSKLEELRDFITKSGKFDTYDKDNFLEFMYERRKKIRPNLTKSAMLRQEAKKIQANLDGVHFNIQPIYTKVSPNGENLLFLEELKPLCHIEAVVVNDIYATASPSIYHVDVRKSLDAPLKKGDALAVFSATGIYSGSFSKGDHITCSGNLCLSRGKKNYVLCVDHWSKEMRKTHGIHIV